MKLKGQLYRITNEREFFASYLTTNGKPVKGFSDFGKARVHVATDMPSGKFAGQTSFIPPISFKTDADSSGRFSVDLPAKPGIFRGYLLMYEQIGSIRTLPNMPSIPIYAPIYRSEVFKLSSVTSNTKNIFVKTRQVKNESGYTQTKANEMAEKIKQKEKFNKVSAIIKSNGISCRAEKQGAEVSFTIRLRASTSFDLKKYIELVAEDIDIDLPGPDFITGICVSKDDIRRRIATDISAQEKAIDTMIAEMIAEDVPAAARSLLTFTVHQLRYPVTSQQTIKVRIQGIPDVKIPIHEIVPDITFGLPRKLF